MPEMTFDVRWPDGTLTQCYSPRLVMHDHLVANQRYSVLDFRDRAHAALAIASERVRAKYGFACTSAAATAEQITDLSSRFDDSATVVVTAMDPPGLPADPTEQSQTGQR